MIRFRTRNSEYSYDPFTFIWRRTKKTERSGTIRTEEGKCIEPPVIALGLPVFFHTQPLTEGRRRIVVTSPVQEIYKPCLLLPSST